MRMLISLLVSLSALLLAKENAHLIREVNQALKTINIHTLTREELNQTKRGTKDFSTLISNYLRFLDSLRSKNPSYKRTHTRIRCPSPLSSFFAHTALYVLHEKKETKTAFEEALIKQTTPEYLLKTYRKFSNQDDYDFPRITILCSKQGLCLPKNESDIIRFVYLTVHQNMNEQGLKKIERLKSDDSFFSRWIISAIKQTKIESMQVSNEKVLQAFGLLARCPAPADLFREPLSIPKHFLAPLAQIGSAIEHLEQKTAYATMLAMLKTIWEEQKYTDYD